MKVTSPQPSIPPPEEPLPNVALEDIYDDISDMVGRYHFDKLHKFQSVLFFGVFLCNKKAHNQESEAHEVGEGDDHILSKEKVRALILSL